MKYHIREVKNEDLLEYIKLGNRVYPRFAIKSEEFDKAIERMTESINKKRIKCIGAYDEKEKIVGRVLIINFLMNFRGKIIKMGGIGGVGVDLPNKKQHICNDMLKYSLELIQNSGSNCSALHPFRPDFYKRMGYGLLNPFYKYHIPSSRFKKSENTLNVKYLEKNEAEDISELFNEHFKKTNGEIDRQKDWAEKIFKDEKNIIVGYRKNGKLVTYALCRTVNTGEDNFMRYDLRVNEFISISKEGDSAVRGFFRNQTDQYENVIMYTQDEDFYYNFDNPSDINKKLLPHANHSFSVGSTGLMFRVLDIEKFMEEYSVGKEIEGESIICSFNINDPFFKNSKQKITLQISEKGFITSHKESSINIDISMEDFSSVIFGAVSLKKMYNYNLVECTDEKLMRIISKYLSSCEKPTYNSAF